MDLFEDSAAPGDNTPEFSVSEIAGTVRRLIEGEMSWVRVKGEVGRVVQARSGHLYFDLKDDKSVLQCMTWKGQKTGLSVMPEEGMEVVAEGKMTASGMQSKFGLNAQRLEIAGEGALMAMLEKRKKALSAEGLFAPERKKPLPYLPEVIGVITSPQGAVIRDILHRLRERFPRKVLIWPVAVQGKDCAPQVARAISGFNKLSPGGALPRPDLVIVARGGGSIEDLWGFNEEIVARAAAASDIPLISAVGHETDTTLIDFVADRRAPTPTAAAEIAVPVRLDLANRLETLTARMRRAVGPGVARRRQRLMDLTRALPRPDTFLNEPRMRLDRVDENLTRGLSRMVEHKRATLLNAASGLRLSSLRNRMEQEKTRLADRALRLGPALRRGTADRARLASIVFRQFEKVRLKDQLQRHFEQLDQLTPRLAQACLRKISQKQEHLDALDRMRRSLGYEATLQRGFAVIRKNSAVITSRDGAIGGLEIEFRDGTVAVEAAAGASRPPKAAKTEKTAKSAQARQKEEDQGSLF